MLVYRVCPTYDREVIVSTSVLHTFELCATPREKPSSSSASACTCTLYVYRSVRVRVRAIEHYIKTNSVEGRDDSDVKHIHWRPYVVNEQTEWVLFHISYSVITVSIYVFMVIINIYICNE